MKGGPFIVRLLLGLGKPKIKRPGVDVAGEIEAVGKNITQFEPGDKVFGTCVGAFAEYATSKSARGMKSALVLKPDNVTFEQAAAAPVAALTALQGLRDKGRIQPGQKVLVNGAAVPGWLTGVGWSDHWSFWQEGYRAIMVTDTALFRYPHYHAPTDTPDRIDYDRTSRVVSGLVHVITDLADTDE